MIKRVETAPQPKPKIQQNQPKEEPGQHLTAIQNIQQHFLKASVMEKIASHCETDIPGVERIVRDICNVIRKDMQKNDGGKLALCSPASIVNCIYDAHAARLRIDSRGHAYLIARAVRRDKEIVDYEATVMPGYKGYVNRLMQSFQDADIRTFLWWEEGEFTYWSEDGIDKYTYKPKKAARSDFGKVIGGAFYMSYWVNGEKKAVIETMDDAEIKLIRTKATTQAVWNEFTGEQIKKTIIRRGCKVRFAMITEDLDALDNQHFDMEDVTPVHKPNLSDKLKSDKYNPFVGEVEPIDIVPETQSTKEGGKTEDTTPGDTVAVDTGDPETLEGGPGITTHDTIDASEGQKEVVDGEVSTIPYPDAMQWIPEAGISVNGVRADNQDIATPERMFNHLITVMAKRTLATARLAVMNENPGFINHLWKNNPSMYHALVNLANKGKGEK